MSQMPKDATARPTAVTDRHLEFLDDALSSDSERLMLGALLMSQFNVSRPEAFTILEYWMRTFVARHDGRKP